MADAIHLTMPELEAGMNAILQSPKDEGVLELIVRRPQTGEREVLQTAGLNTTDGLVGDNWKKRGTFRAPDPAMQLTVMNFRVIGLIAREKSLWPLAGDQLYIDFDLSMENLPAGTQVAIGTAVIEISPQPHTGCKKFLARFGQDALEFVNSPRGKQLRLRGLNAHIVRPGMVSVGDKITKIDRPWTMIPDNR